MSHEAYTAKAYRNFKEKGMIRAGRPGKTDYLLAIDPGGVRNGYAIFEHEHGAPHSILCQKGIKHFDDMNEFLKSMSYVTILVYENYLIRPGGRQNVGSSGKVMQVIGKLDMWAASLGIPVFKQEPGVLTIAMKITGYKKKSHVRDDMSAWLHGAYHLRQRKWYMSALERSRAS